MTPRVSSHNSIERALMRMRSQSAELAAMQEQISSGVRLNRPSAEPSAFVEVRAGQDRARTMQAYQEVIDDVSASLNQSVASLVDVGGILTRAAEIASEGANSGLHDTAYATLAAEMDRLIDRLLTMANTKSGDRYLFSGTASSTPPFEVTASDNAGRPVQITYRGGEERARAVVGDLERVDSAYSGAEVFQQMNRNTFDTLISLRDDFRDPGLTHAQRSQTLSQRLGDIERARDWVLDLSGEQSVALESMQSMADNLADARLSLAQRTGALESADMAAAVVRLSEAQTLYQATMAATARMLSASFLDFLA